MLKSKKARLVIFFTLAFLLYFLSESMLRQAAVANVDSESVDVNSIVAELPGFLKEKISYRLEIAELRENIIKAKSSANKAVAISMLAEAVTDPVEKERLFKQVLELFPDIPESGRAYTFFLLNPKTEFKLGIPEFRAYIFKQPDLKQPGIWQAGYSKLQMLNIPAKQKLDFLSPLLESNPKYKDYYALYQNIENLAEDLNDFSLVEKARALRMVCLDKPSVSKILSDQRKKKQEEEKKRKAAAKKLKEAEKERKK
jgi:hypothetical protein